MKQKQFLKMYGPMFAVVWVAAFILLVTLRGKGIDLPTVWGDVLIEKAGLTLYFPFTSSAAFGAFAVSFYEMWRFMKRF
jgi:hypothetical protein